MEQNTLENELSDLIKLIKNTKKLIKKYPERFSLRLVLKTLGNRKNIILKQIEETD